jgi:hypothetical protein
MNWSFAFLQYVAGAVTVASLVRKSVLTGPISGCFLFKYNDGGHQKVAHVGTANDSESDETKRANGSWVNALAQRQVREASHTGLASALSGLTSVRFERRSLAEHIFVSEDAAERS